ncbi:DUF5610 domain-containing protein [Shewanella maritima]|uniref:DUF5610 domain-containing protein n=1 Tax=Shewanella maritima TaxID=2520507 RepID=UPI0037368514
MKVTQSNTAQLNSELPKPASVLSKSASGDGVEVLTIKQAAKRLQHGSIAAAQELVSLTSGEESSMALLYKAAVEAINEALAPKLGENSIQNTLSSSVDYSPLATAERIVGFATQFLSLHQQQNEALGYTEQVDSFMVKITDAIEQGFTEATGILSGLSVLEGDIEQGVSETYQHVQSGLAQFKQQSLSVAFANTDEPS